jgi:alanine racemase
MKDLLDFEGTVESHEGSKKVALDASIERGEECSSHVRPVWMDIDLEALRQNYLEVRKRLPAGVKVIAAVKANAYGHGAVPVAHVLSRQGVDGFATGSFEDALAIRAAGISTKVLLLPCQLPESSEELLHHDLIPTVYNLETANAISKAALTTRAVYVKVDCGLGRFGVHIGDALAFVKAVAALPKLMVEGLYTHVPFDDTKGKSWAIRQLGAFRELRTALANGGIAIPVTQALSSAGIVAQLDDGGCSAVCPGHLLYGLRTVSEDVADCSAFRPVLRSISTRIIHTSHRSTVRLSGMSGRRKLAAGTTVGVVPLGLVDGYRPARTGEAAMLIRGQRVPVLGVSLEATTLDLSRVSRPVIGEHVVVLGQDGGENVGLEEIANWQNASALETVMTFNRQIPARYLEETPS